VIGVGLGGWGRVDEGEEECGAAARMLAMCGGERRIEARGIGAGLRGRATGGERGRLTRVGEESEE
jgi:hypothetical protein